MQKLEHKIHRFNGYMLWWKPAASCTAKVLLISLMPILQTLTVLMCSCVSMLPRSYARAKGAGCLNRSQKTCGQLKSCTVTVAAHQADLYAAHAADKASTLPAASSPTPQHLPEVEQPTWQSTSCICLCHHHLVFEVQGFPEP